MKHQIVMRCITDALKGYGNFGRCVALAESMRNKGYGITFIIDHNNPAIRELQKRKFNHVLIPKSLLYDKESTFITNMIHLKNSKIVIIDMREYGEKISKKLINKNFKVVLLDDAWCKKAYADVIINGTIIKHYHEYEKINKNTKLFVGSKYFITNNEFRKHRKMIYEIFDRKKYLVVVSVGGSDPDELSLFILRSISELPNINIKVIIGPFFKHLTKLHKFIKNKKNIDFVCSPVNIWQEFQNADVVISNAGSTLYELAIQRVPTICIPAVEHQVLYAKEFASKGSAINLEVWKNLNSETIKKTLSYVLDDKIKRKKMCMAGNKIIDGKGLSRVTCILTEYFKQYLK